MIESMFPSQPNKSQSMMQSLLTEKLKKAVADLLPEFLRESQKTMPADLKRFYAQEKFNQLSVRSVKSERDLMKFQKLGEVRLAREAYKKNIEIMKNALVEFELAPRQTRQMYWSIQSASPARQVHQPESIQPIFQIH